MNPFVSFTTIALSIALVPFAIAQDGSHEAAPIFNGKDLTGWQGDTALWSVVDGVITGESTADGEGKIAQNTFLIWKGGTVEDFELTLKVRVTGDNNSGIQYRSNVIDEKASVVAGYQMDVHPREDLIGMLYEEKGRGILAQRGTNVGISAEGKKRLLGRFEKKEAIDISKWNEYTITARGNRLTHKINGEITCTAVDDDGEKRSLSGVIALQLHAGAPMKIEAKDIRLQRFRQTRPAPPEGGTPASDASKSVRITAGAKQEGSFFRKTWRQPKPVKSATLKIESDGEFVGFFNGKKVATESPTKNVVIRGQEFTGFNVLAIKLKNGNYFSAELEIKHEDGDRSVIVSDTSWQCRAGEETPKGWKGQRPDSKEWKAATKFSGTGETPVPAGRADAPLASSKTPPPATLPGFRVDKVYSAPTDSGANWVAMTVTDDGRIAISDWDQGLFFLAPRQEDKPESIQKIDLPITNASGVQWAFNSLYVCVNGEGSGGNGSGVYRLLNAKGDETLDTVKVIKKLDGEGEFGPQTITLGPKRLNLYVASGHSTSLPEKYSRSRPSEAWGNDRLLEPLAGSDQPPTPGGWIAKVRPSGIEWIVQSIGLNRPTGLAFNSRGEIFATDSGTPADLGTPWYRPSQVLHVPRGSDFGWRGDSKNLPSYFPDRTPSMLSALPGVSGKMTFGGGTKFPAKYQRALYTCNRTFGTIHAVQTKLEGASYTATSEEFITGTNLPVTDIAIGGDGAMYFITGGSKDNPSALWRVSYTGDEKTTPAYPSPATSDVLASHNLRNQLADYQGSKNPRIVPRSWEVLDHADRAIRSAARVALEHQDPKNWSDKYSQATGTDRILQASIALARVGSPDQQKIILKKLATLDWAKLSNQQKIDQLRAYGLAFARLGEPPAEARNELAERLAKHFPSGDAVIDTELGRLLIYLGSAKATDTTLALLTASTPPAAPDWAELAKRNQEAGEPILAMLENMPDPQGLLYASFLRNAIEGWTPASKAKLASWLDTASQLRAGKNLPGYIEKIRKVADSTPSKETTPDESPPTSNE